VWPRSFLVRHPATSKVFSPFSQCEAALQLVCGTQ
jgi:hypothetical protein